MKVPVHLRREHAREQLRALQDRYAAGDRHALMIAIRVCARDRRAMPAWVAREYIRAFDAVNNYRAKSWDEVFGDPLPKNAQLAALRKRLEKSVHVWNDVNQHHLKGTPIDDELFTAVGRKLGLGLTQTKQYYAHFKRRAGK